MKKITEIKTKVLHSENLSNIKKVGIIFLKNIFLMKK